MALVEPEVVTRAGASCTIYRDAPSWAGLATAAVGRFACTSADAGADLLAEVCFRLETEGFAAVVGPMDADARHARCGVAEGDGAPPFPLEPAKGTFDHEAFSVAGFAPIGSCGSDRAHLDGAIEPRVPEAAGLTTTTWNGCGLMGRKLGAETA